ncbi:tRNA (adenosine(37)-N6)-dimethylallyltransferase MiaA [Sediminicurvatus halobius]|uniref:tRNA dimethylallyltransferase n=1 Tax=Sediminicurvatus halobius TaxID=2182432 RepID=A0A2U2N1K7_9GAMM|nr:tRNA (adenosine(37)-N6)-dimethylallyltransferase MiaA [Spiribacter halobius]PWG62879.1 tRNA (adenosine(37)-N6)-dimethylallyltransferase MiaA [Spiribacter halobius]UEX76969.1 tRNA (adenosine(37)-N6)-dimethylallyltransferase MiaA [Spiribacter halobius]
MADTDAPLVCLMGPTAAGKTELAVALAETGRFGLISVDSVMVYRGLDIGSAKPSPAVLARAPHWLIDIADPAEAYSAARFSDDALAAIAAVRREGRIPLLVGGTMLYFQALLQGLSPLPAADPGVRLRLEAEAAADGWPALHRRLAAVDPATAARLHPRDAQRIQRALEVHALTGEAPSTLLARRGQERSPGRPVKLAIAPPERTVLHRRIGERFRRMLEQGLIEEVAGLRARGDLGPELPALRAVGYRQVWEYLEGAYDRATLLERGAAATRRFAKRQLTWLRREAAVTWFDGDDAALQNRVREHLARMLE